ncbi:TetR/AcrR family transcriptional regulator [Roseobacter sinensis]|uniref:TetR/AcrR family transcriptional regulator n=1 Tax=Roseobacter sinensis TaxID=2931391 RepID=A0ABT3BJA3_9RHOB|nr:TetR/AcrR family transcriptional regulator [Roseobacter sp. WL0113]MCV3273655.1 TetR/AcrR family transcriptional regulator [Roseobacter sp. WL0113]
MTTREEISTGSSRAKIISTCTELFLEHGFAGTSMSAIAKACQMTKASLYYHFSGKEDLFIACVTDGYGVALRALQSIVADETAAPHDKLKRALIALYETTISSPVGRMSPLIAEVSRAFPSVARSFHSEYIAPQQALLWQIIEAGIASGDFRAVDRKQLFHIVFGPMVTLSLSREMFASFDDLDEHFPVEELRDSHIEVIIRMIRA